MASPQFSPGVPCQHQNSAESELLREAMRRHRQQLARALLSRRSGGMTLAKSYSDFADELLRKHFQTAISEAGVPMLLGAVGGYGRRLLGLQSDLDLCFVTSERPERVADTVEAILYPLWDAGISVGHQIVRPTDVAEDASADLMMATELLDFRALSGDLSLLDSVKERLTNSVFSKARVAEFIAQLEASGRKRHARYGDSVYLLEPDVKNGNGGLRDLDVALWAARARFGTGETSGLRDLGVLTEEGQQEVEQALGFLWSVRFQLHHSVGRKVDRLTFAEQECVAKAMGYEPQSGESAPLLQRNGEIVEAFMSDYYRNARTIARTSQRILGRAKRRPSFARAVPAELGGGLIECEGGVGLADSELLQQEPELALRVYATAVERELRVLSQTRDAIACATSSASFCARLRDSEEAAILFVHLACTVQSVRFSSDSVLTELHDTGLLLAMIPEFAPVVGRVHHDLYHVYTVDVHSIAAVDRLRTLIRGELATTWRLASRLATSVARRRVLFLATLLHDVGKAIGGRNHAERGATMAKEILGRLGLAPEEINDACHLILHHLTMYMVAVRRDLSDPDTLVEFLRDVPGGQEGLLELYLLTVADVSTTSPVAMTKWKRSMMDELYRASDALLSGTAAGATNRVETIKGQARLLWADEAKRDQFEAYLTSMSHRYFLSNTAEDVISHAQLAIGRRRSSVSLSLMSGQPEGALGLCVVTGESLKASKPDLCVVASDRPGLLAAIAAAIAASRLVIQAAQINTRVLPEGGQQAVDLFWVKGQVHDDPGAEQRIRKLEETIVQLVEGTLSPDELETPSRTLRQAPPVSPEVVFYHHASQRYTVIEVLAPDEPALLYQLALTFHQVAITIGVAKISTEGRRAVDVFYVTELDGSKMIPGVRTELVRSSLLQTLACG